MDLHSMALKLGGAAQGVCYFVGFAFEVYKLESVGLYLLNSSGLSM